MQRSHFLLSQRDGRHSQQAFQIPCSFERRSLADLSPGPSLEKSMSDTWSLLSFAVSVTLTSPPSAAPTMRKPSGVIRYLPLRNLNHPERTISLEVCGPQSGSPPPG